MPTYTERLVRVLVGLAVFGLGISLVIEADLGAAPWDVFHTGVSERTGLSIGSVILIVGLLLLLLWIPLQQRPGIATVLNAVVIGVTADLFLALLGEPDLVVVRVAFLVAGIMLTALGSGLYIGAGLGSGPRDGIMMGLSRRGISVRMARTSIEVTAVVVGVLLGGRAGVGTVAFALGIGPLVQVFLPRLQLPPRTGRMRASAATAG